MIDPSGIDSLVQNLIIYACSPVLNNPVQPATDPSGYLLQIPMTADLPDENLESPIVHVGIRTGRKGMPNGFGRMQMSADKTQWYNLLYSEDCRAVFTVYATSDYMRRYLAEWLQWGMMWSYAIGTDGTRLDHYIINWLCNVGIFPKLHPMFEETNYDPPNNGAPRPTGLPFLAQFSMNYTLQMGFATPLASVQPTGSLNITPNPFLTPAQVANGGTEIVLTGTSELLPITIPLPPRYFPIPSS